MLTESFIHDCCQFSDYFPSNYTFLLYRKIITRKRNRPFEIIIKKTIRFHVASKLTGNICVYAPLYRLFSLIQPLHLCFLNIVPKLSFNIFISKLFYKTFSLFKRLFIWLKPLVVKLVVIFVVLIQNKLIQIV